jgi:hypothetical protein
MNTPRQPTVHYRGATDQRIQQLQARQASGQVSRPILHLNPKKRPVMQSAGNDAAAELGAARPGVSESEHSM